MPDERHAARRGSLALLVEHRSGSRPAGFKANVRCNASAKWVPFAGPQFVHVAQGAVGLNEILLNPSLSVKGGVRPPLGLCPQTSHNAPLLLPRRSGSTSSGRIIPSCWQPKPAAMRGVLLCLFHSGSCQVNMYFLSAPDKPRKRVEPSGASVTSSVK